MIFFGGCISSELPRTIDVPANLNFWRRLTKREQVQSAPVANENI